MEALIWPGLYHKEELCESVQAQQSGASAKRSFLYKCFSGVLDYQHDASLLAFQYDRAMLGRFIGRAHAAPRLQLRCSGRCPPSSPKCTRVGNASRHPCGHHSLRGEGSYKAPEQ